MCRNLDKQIEDLLDSQIKASNYKARKFLDLYNAELVKIERLESALKVLKEV